MTGVETEGGGSASNGRAMMAFYGRLKSTTVSEFLPTFMQT